MSTFLALIAVVAPSALSSFYGFMMALAITFMGRNDDERNSRRSRKT